MTSTANRLTLTLKALAQLGPGAIILYGIYRVGLRTGHFHRIDSSLKRTAAGAAAASLVDLFPLPRRGALLEALGPAGLRAALRAANSIINGKVRIFGTIRGDLRLAPKKALQHWTRYEIEPALLSTFSVPFDDIKFLWEPARFAWALNLARAFHLTADEKYARAFWSQFERFERANPPYMGPHWMNGQEVAIRLMALLWCAQVFKAARCSTAPRLARLRLSMAHHAARIPPTIIYARSQNNNHLVTESTALYLAGIAMQHRAWLDQGWRLLNHALRGQISSYGEYVQHSTNYHRLVLEAALLADAARRARGQAWPVLTQQALARASHWLFSVLDAESGRVPNLGPNDGAHLLPLTPLPFDDFRSTVQAAARAFLRTGLPPGPWDELSLWLGLPAAGRTADSTAYAAEHVRGPDSWAYLQASAFQSRLGHMDQLHLDLWWRGAAVASDAGSYLYNASPPWDNPLVSSRVHNVVTIDGREQMTRAGRFMVLDWFPASERPVLTVTSPIVGQVLGSHHGFSRMGIGYERTVSCLESGRWRVVDSLKQRRPSPHSFRLHWLLADGDWRLQQKSGLTSLRLHLPQGTVQLNLSASKPAGQPVITLIRAGRLLEGAGPALPFEGWIAPTYGVKVPALSLAVEVVASASFSFTSEFILSK